MGYFQVTNEAGKRHRWTIKSKASSLIACCKERMSYHGERVKFWQAQHLAAEKALKETGITIQHHAVTGGKRTEAKLDTSMASRVSECEDRLKSNRTSLERFRAYLSFFTLAGDVEFELSPDDVLFFNVANADVTGEEAETQQMEW